MKSGKSESEIPYPQQQDDTGRLRSDDMREVLEDISDKLRRLNKKAAKYPDLAMLSYFIEMAYMESCTYNESAHGIGEEK